MVNHLNAASKAVERAVQSGRLIKPPICLECYAPATLSPLVAHHYMGYAPENWLNVRWLCNACHGLAHRKDGTVHRDPNPNALNRKPERRIRAVGYLRPQLHSLLCTSAAREKLSVSEELERILLAALSTTKEKADA